MVVLHYFLSGLLLLSMQVLHIARGHAEAVAVTTLTSTEAASLSGTSASLNTASKDQDVDEDVVYQTVYACQDETLKISCLDEYSVKVVRANYGRFSIAICNDVGRADFSVNCHSPGTLNILQQRCDGKPSCEAFANSTDFPVGTDPCPSTVKYLEAQFFCSKPQMSSTNERRPPMELDDSRGNCYN